MRKQWLLRQDGVVRPTEPDHCAIEIAVIKA
jgi:hypothetical protein